MADDDKDAKTGKWYKPHFKWGKYGRDALVFILDTLLLSFACIIMYAFVRGVVFVCHIDTSTFDSGNWSDIVGHVAWPFVAFVTIFLLRNPLRQLLYETEGLAGRSFFQQGGNGNVLGADANVSPILDYEIKTDETDAIKTKMFTFMEKQYGTYIPRRQTLRGGRYFFDGAVKLNDSTFIIVTKHCWNREDDDYLNEFELEDFLGKAHSVFSCATPMMRNDYVFEICIAVPIILEEKVDRLMKMTNRVANQIDFHIRFRFFEYGLTKGNNLKEVFVP